jgi:hypothetical protein
VDAAYADLPTTTAEVLFGDDAATTGSPAAFTAPAGFEEVHTATFGAAPLSWLFAAPGGEEDRALDRPRERAAAWAGGRAWVWADGDATATGLALVDGGGSDAPLCASVEGWYGAAFPDAQREQAEGATVFTSAGQAAVLRCDGDDVRLATAPDLVTATRMVGG